MCACARVVLRVCMDTSDYVSVCKYCLVTKTNAKAAERKSYFISRRFHPLQLPITPSLSFCLIPYSLLSPPPRFLLYRLSSICNCVIYRPNVGSRSNMHAHVQHGGHMRQHRQRHLGNRYP